MEKGAKKLTPIIAIILVVVMVVNTVWVSAAQISIGRSEEEGTQAEANNYLVENTGYVSANLLQRMYEVLTLYQTPEDWKGYEEQAGIYIGREQYAKALLCIRQAIDLSGEASDEEKASLWLQKGCLHTLREEYEEALAALEKSVEYNSENSEGYLILAQLYMEQGDEEKTISNMEAYLIRNPGNAEAEQMIAQLYMAKGDYSSAKEWFLKAQESGGGAEVYYQYGLCAIQDGSFEEAETHFNQAITLDDTVGDVYYYRGVCRLMIGDYEAALEDLKLAEQRTADTELKSDITELIQDLTNV